MLRLCFSSASLLLNANNIATHVSLINSANFIAVYMVQVRYVAAKMDMRPFISILQGRQVLD